MCLASERPTEVTKVISSTDIPRSSVARNQLRKYTVFKWAMPRGHWRIMPFVWRHMADGRRCRKKLTQTHHSDNNDEGAILHERIYASMASQTGRISPFVHRIINVGE